MKILQINSHYNQGGAARIMACLHRELLKDGEEAYAAYGRGEAAEEKNVFCIDRPIEVYWDALCCRMIGLNGWGNRRGTKMLIQKMQEIKPDIVHIHALHGYYVNDWMLFDYLNRERIPCVWTMHDCHAFTGNCGYFFACQRWRKGCGNCPDIRRYPKSWFFDFSGYMWRKKREWFTKNEKIIVSPSDWLTGEVKRSFLGKYECVTIQNGIDTHGVFYPRGRENCRKKYGFEIDEKLVLGIAAGFGDERKGAKYLLGLARALEREAKVILIGWEKKNDAMLEGISNVILMPHTKDTDTLADYYSMADVFVLPSLAENYATVSLEAMACGTPVVGFRTGGIPEQLSGGRGITVETGNQDALLYAVKKALEKESGLLRGEALAETIRENNSVEKMTAAYKKVYQRLLERHGSDEDIRVYGNL